MADLPSGTVTFLFTDIEGSTRLLKQLREGYRDLLADHKWLLREAFEEAGGREIDTQGDAFFVAFPRAKDAVAAAVAGQRALASHAWPDGVEVKVRMGIHTSEPLVGRERYVGLGVHRAARICSAAHGGQILLSDATRAVAEDELPAGVALRDLGAFELKDLDRPERLFQLVPSDLPSDFPALRTGQEGTAFAGRESELAEAAQTAVAGGLWRRRRILVLAVAAALLAAAVAIPMFALVPDEGGGGIVVSPNSVAVLDPASGEVVEDVVSGIGAGPTSVAIGVGAVWILNSRDFTVSRIDPETRTARSIGTGTTPSDLAVGGGAVWLVTPLPDIEIFRLDPTSNQIERTTRLHTRRPGTGSLQSYIAFYHGALWVSNASEDVVWRVDPDGSSFVEIPRPVVPSFPGAGIAVGEGAVWVNGFDDVTRIDPSTNATTTIGVRNALGGIAVGEHSVWTVDGLEGTLWRIDPIREDAQRTIPVGDGPRGVSVGFGSVWVANSSDGSVSQVDPATNRVTGTIEIGGAPHGVAVGQGAVWVTVG